MLRVIPLGGLGEIGLNSMVFECRDELLLVDAGLLFPPPELPGVELIIPDFGYLRDAAAQLGPVLLTHAHGTTSARCRSCSASARSRSMAPASPSR